MAAPHNTKLQLLALMVIGSHLFAGAQLALGSKQNDLDALSAYSLRSKIYPKAPFPSSSPSTTTTTTTTTTTSADPNKEPSFKDGEHKITLADAVVYLRRYGHLRDSANPMDPKSPTLVQLEKAFLSFQKMFKLPLTGFADKQTLSMMRLQRCGNDDLDDGKPATLAPGVNPDDVEMVGTSMAPTIGSSSPSFTDTLASPEATSTTSSTTIKTSFWPDWTLKWHTDVTKTPSDDAKLDAKPAVETGPKSEPIKPSSDKPKILSDQQDQASQESTNLFKNGLHLSPHEHHLDGLGKSKGTFSGSSGASKSPGGSSMSSGGSSGGYSSSSSSSSRPTSNSGSSSSSNSRG